MCRVSNSLNLKLRRHNSKVVNRNHMISLFKLVIINVNLCGSYYYGGGRWMKSLIFHIPALPYSFHFIFHSLFPPFKSNFQRVCYFFPRFLWKKIKINKFLLSRAPSWNLVYNCKVSLNICDIETTKNCSYTAVKLYCRCLAILNPHPHINKFVWLCTKFCKNEWKNMGGIEMYKSAIKTAGKFHSLLKRVRLRNDWMRTFLHTLI
jgi:hypothetical protein